MSKQPDLFGHTANDVFFPFGNVMGNAIDPLHVEIVPGSAKDVLNDLIAADIRQPCGNGTAFAPFAHP